VSMRGVWLDTAGEVLWGNVDVRERGDTGFDGSEVDIVASVLWSFDCARGQRFRVQQRQRARERV
jgi:hypothetical protein